MSLLRSVKYGLVGFFFLRAQSCCSETNQRVMSARNLRWALCDWLATLSPDYLRAKKSGNWRPGLVIQLVWRLRKLKKQRSTTRPADHPLVSFHPIPFFPSFMFHSFIFNCPIDQLKSDKAQLTIPHAIKKSGTSDPGPFFDRAAVRGNFWRACLVSETRRLFRDSGRTPNTMRLVLCDLKEKSYYHT